MFKLTFSVDVIPKTTAYNNALIIIITYLEQSATVSSTSQYCQLFQESAQEPRGIFSWTINPLAADLKSLTGQVVISRDSTVVQLHQVRHQVRYLLITAY